jgi:hypothetical protein
MTRFALLAALLAFVAPAAAQKKAAGPSSEDDYYRMVTLPLPDEVVLEVGGLDWLDAGKTKLAAATRRGELWQAENVYADKPAAGVVVGKEPKPAPDPATTVTWRRLLFGLHEPLGLLTRPDGIYTAQRAELTRLKLDAKGEKVSRVESFCNDWEISGSYHEYAFGPKLDHDGNLWVTLNRPFGGGQEPAAYWRGWAVKVDPKGKMIPVCPGLRSPCGLGPNAAGDMFYTDNQGDWVAVCKLSHLKPGSFQGNPIALESCDHPLANFKNPGKGYPKSGLLWPKAAKEIPHLAAPAVWFPYPEMGKSHSDVVFDATGGKFGPFDNQLFVGDQGNAIMVRVDLEKVDGEYQGACFPFRKGFASGVLRMCWGHDGSMFVGGTNRGWGGGSRPYMLQRLVWTGKTPFEVLTMRAAADGFRLTFTEPVDPKTAADPRSYAMSCWTYHYHSNYGDKPQDTHPLKVTKAAVGADGKTVTLTVDGLAPYYVHELKLDGVRAADGRPLLHPVGYYTLNRVPAK